MIKRLVEPFDRLSIVQVAVWYLPAVALQLTLSRVLYSSGGGGLSDMVPDGVRERDFIFAVVVVAPPVEEFLFRGVPDRFFGTDRAAFWSSVIWSLNHGRTAPMAAVLAPVFTKLWRGGYRREAILLHAAHNAAIIIHRLIRRRFKR